MASRAIATSGKALAKRWKSKRYAEALAVAKQIGLLDGPRTELLRGRMPARLVREAMTRTGTRSQTKLIEIALAFVVAQDEFAEWLVSQRGTIPKDIDLEF
jgi:hypothetical protein